MAHASVKITALSYNESLTWLYTSKAKTILFGFFPGLFVLQE